jgi:hypothetical protein
MKEFLRCGLCINFCRTLVLCIFLFFISMDRCFWEERILGISIYKNDELLTHHSVTFTVGPHLEASYGFWRHTNFLTKKDGIYLNIVINNFLEGTNFNYSCTPLNTPGGCRQDYVMLEIYTANSMSNIYIGNFRNKRCNSHNKLLYCN